MLLSSKKTKNMLFFTFLSHGFLDALFIQFLNNCQGQMAHNVPAVYDGLTARIEKCAAFLGLANCGCSEPWEGA
jgi:hypothetical protein